MEDKYWNIGKTEINYNNIKIKIYDKERMLIELVRYKNKISYDMYKEIINNYRLIIDKLDLLKLQDYLNNFKNLVNKYINLGYEEIYAKEKVAQDIILSYLFKAKYKNNIAIKGVIVMYNLSNNKRRATIDIDVDLINIYLNNDNLYNIFTSYIYNIIDHYHIQ